MKTTNPALPANDDPYADLMDSAYWFGLKEEYDDIFRTYNQKCDGIDKIYSDIESISKNAQDSEYRLFWANVEVLKPSTYARAPVPVVDAAFGERDSLKIHASEIQERALIYERDRDDMHDTLKQIRDDLILGNRGVPWVRIAVSPAGEAQISFEHVDRKDFLHDPARKWKEVGWVGRKIYLNRNEIMKRWPDAKPSEFNFETKSTEKQDSYTVNRKACIIEIWSKTHNCVVWITEGRDKVLQIIEPYLKLDNFFPCPRPAYGTLKRGSLVPTPDFLQVQSQLNQINDLTIRIGKLSRALKLAGVYDGNAREVREAVEQLLANELSDVQLKPVQTNTNLGAAGVANAIHWFPLDKVAAAIQQCVTLRSQLIQDVYEITGISDIMRGSTDANETLGAQQLKSQYGSVRIRDKVAEMQRVAADMFKIAGEIIAENFPIEQLALMAQYSALPTREQLQQQAQAVIDQTEDKIRQLMANPEIVAAMMQDPQTVFQKVEQVRGQAMQQAQEILEQESLQDVDELLKSNRMRPFSLDVDTESTVEADTNALKQRTNEFAAALSQFLPQVMALAQGMPNNPGAIDFAAELLRMMLKPYRVGRSIDAQIDSFIESAKEQIEQAAQNPQPDPEQQKAEMENKQMEVDIATKLREAERKEAETKSTIELNDARAEEVRAKANYITHHKGEHDGQRAPLP